jgi:lysophospholipase L1-like esterase
MKKNLNDYPLILTATVFLLVAVLSLFQFQYDLAGFTLKNVDIFSDLKSKPEQPVKTPEKPAEEDDFFKPQYEIEPNINELDFNKDQNRINEKIRSSIFNLLLSNYPNDTIFVKGSRLVLKNQPIVGNVQQLKFFFEGLDKTKSEVVRIAHFGDSMIEGDLVTADLREELQKKFGGNGVGFLPITSQDINFRQTTKISFSSDWKAGTLHSGNPNRYPIGFNGETFVPKAGSWVQYSTPHFYSYLKNFNTVKLLYTKAIASNVNLTFSGSERKSIKLIPGQNLNIHTISAFKPSTIIRVEFPLEDQAHIFGVSLENGNGIYVDNFALRGNSGIDLIKIDETLMKEFASKMNYRLIIFEFGLNALSVSKSNFATYEKNMIQVIEKFKRNFPNTSFLIVSVQDKGLKTDPAVKQLLEAQKNIAKATNIAFWNFFEVMGGENSMANWVDANPPLASKDYIHFNDHGAKKLASFLAEALIQAYSRLR